MTATNQRFPIGTRFTPRGKNRSECVVVDFLTTTNSAGEIVRTRYVATHIVCGQIVIDCDVTETTIAIGLAVNA